VVIRHPSPNFGPRRNGERPSLVVLHYTEMLSTQAALQRLCDPGAEVSSHYLIGRDGALWQLVDDKHRAWHAGQGEWLGRGDVNSRSIGIELDNDGASPFSAPLMQTLESCLAAILSRWDIPPSGVIAHSDMAPERKIDPGPRFDWQRLARSGLSIWPDQSGSPATALSTSLDALGYPKIHASQRLDAFRLRFRPGTTGPESDGDRRAADSLAKIHHTFEK